MIRTIFVWSCIVDLPIGLGFLVILTYPFDRMGKVIHLYARLWGKICLLANRVKVRMEGTEDLKGEGPLYFYVEPPGEL